VRDLRDPRPAGWRRGLIAALWPALLLSWLVPASAQTPPASQPVAITPEVRELIQAARQAEQAQDYASASEAYKKVLERLPQWALIRQSLALTYHLRGLYPQAIEHFEKALALDDALWGAYLFLGMDYYKTNQFKRAIPALKRSLELNPERTEAEARFWLGLSHAALGRHEKAIEQFERVRDLRPNGIEALYRLARSYDSRAAQLYERIGRIAPRSALVHLLQAERYASEERKDLAQVEYRRALWLRPDLRAVSPLLRKFGALGEDAPPAAGESGFPLPDVRANLELAGLYADLGDPARAVRHLERIAGLKKMEGEAAHLTAQARRRLEELSLSLEEASPGSPSAGRESAALNALRALEEGGEPGPAALVQALEEEPHPRLRIALARVYLTEGRLSEAESALRKILSAAPDHPDALYWLGKVYKRRAAATLDEMIRADPDSYRVHQLVAAGHEEDTAYEKALTSYRKALEKRPDAAGLSYAIGNVYWKMRRYEEAERWLRAELQANPYHGLAHYRLGALYADRGEAAGAVRHLRRALEPYPKLMDARLHLGRALMAQEQYAEAAAEFEKVAEADPAGDRIHYLLANAYRKLGRMDDARRAMAEYRRRNRQRLEDVQQDVRRASESIEEASGAAQE